MWGAIVFGAAIPARNYFLQLIRHNTGKRHDAGVVVARHVLVMNSSRQAAPGRSLVAHARGLSSHGRQGGRERAQRYWDDIQTFAYSDVDPYSAIRICYDSQIRSFHAIAA